MDLPLIAAVVAFVAVAGTVLAAPPGPPGTYVPDPKIGPWFERQHNIDNKSCCGVGDGHVLDDNQWRTSAQGYEVLINGMWHRIDRPNMLKAGLDDPNPTGSAVVWYTYNSTKPGGVQIWCFTPGWES